MERQRSWKIQILEFSQSLIIFQLEKDANEREWLVRRQIKFLVLPIHPLDACSLLLTCVFRGEDFIEAR